MGILECGRWAALKEKMFPRHTHPPTHTHTHTYIYIYIYIYMNMLFTDVFFFIATESEDK